MARWKVLISAPYFQPVVGQYRAQFEQRACELVLPQVHERLDEEALLVLVGDIDAALCGDDQFTERVLTAAPKLRVIAKWGTGVDSIDRACAARLGIAVRNTPGAFTAPVADTTLGYVLSFARNLPWMSEAVKAGAWHKTPGVSLSETTLGVVGVGNIGKAVTRRARAFGMRVLGTDIAPVDHGFVDETQIELVELERLLGQSDFVTLHPDLNPSSHHLIAERQLAAMKATARLINTSRGPVVDEAALCRALARGEIAGAALDVFEREPLPPQSALRGFPQVLLAPHNSNSSRSAWKRVHANTVRSLFEELDRRVQ